jgi:hypothetical protein
MRNARYAAVAALFVALLFLPHAARGLPASDDTPPIVSYSIDGIAGANDWFRGSTHGNNITLHWSVSDPESQIISTTGCDPAIQIPGPTRGTTRTCEATSDGGTTRITTRSLKIDADPPTTTATPSRQPNGAGWFNSPFSISWPGSDATSGLASCSGALSYNGPQTTGTTETGTCTDNAGNSSSDSFLVKYDTVPPDTNVDPSRPPNGAGWFSAPFTLSWDGSDPGGSGIASCRTDLNYNGPDTNGTTVSGTCSDNAGNTSSDPFMVKYDTQAPTTVASVSRSPNAAGWYRSPLSVTWSGSDTGGSGIASCRPQLDFSGPDTTGTTVSGSCTDRAGNSSSDGVLLKYDSTPPSTQAAPTPAPNANGWFNGPVSVDWQGSDATSGIASCDSAVGYSGPDTNGTSVSGSCSDRAGNSSANAFVVRYDTHAPTTVAAPSRPANSAGWYQAPLSITWTGSDPGGSGIDSCRAPLTYSGPDTPGATSNGSCTDKAGNSSSDSFVVKYDETGPTVNAPSPGRGPDHNGWYNHPVRIDWSGSDTTSGIASCTSRTYGGPDDANADPVGTCTDAAGNSASRDFSLEYDATGPTVAVTPARPADHAGWYNQPVSISWSGTDATSGVDSCTPTVTYSGPDSSNASSGGGCTDHAGNTASPPPLSFKYDATAPVTGTAPARRPDLNGWYNHPVAVNWTGTDRASGVGSCSSLVYSGPDTGSDSRLGTCTDKAGNMSAPVTWIVHYDSTAPGAIAAKPDRAPDHHGWYNQAVGIHWSGSDGLAGIASCSSLTYAGPEIAGGTVSGRCTDLAGNASRPVPFALSYDSTPPTLRALSLEGLDGLVRLRWKIAGADQLRLARSPGMKRGSSSEIYAGDGSSFADRRVKNYVRYRYTLAAEDSAGNTVQRTASVMPLPVLYAPRGGAHLRVHARPLFAWKPAKRAHYYNFQLWVDGHQAGSWWPTRARLRLPARWSQNGKAQRLARGTYTWYVWPGRGPRKLGRYGALLGKSSFVVG